MQYRIPDTVVFQDLHGEFVLLDLEGESYFGLDTIGSDIWRLLSDGLDQAAIVERLLVSYEGSRDEITGDVAEFVDRLLEHGLLKAHE